MVVLNGSIDEWSESSRLDDTQTGAPGYALYGLLEADIFYFAIAADTVAIGAGTTLWLDTDLDRTTGYQIWGFTGGAEYHVEIAADGSAGLYSGGPGGTFIADLDYAYSADGRVLELAVPGALLGGATATRVFADVNNAAFLPNDYSNVDFVVAAVPDIPPVSHGTITLDGDLSDWTADKRLDSAATGAAGHALYGDVQDGHILFAISAEAVTIGGGTTLWLDTDLDRTTGYQIWGFTGGTEYNIEVAADGSAKLYSGGPGETFIADLETFRSADGSVLEIAVATADLGGATSARVFADVNDTTFLPNDYANVDLFVGETPDVPPYNDPDYRIGIVYSQTTAENFYDLTAYGQLFMSAQAQAMQAGIPFDLLTEDDLKDVANLTGYDALVFPAFSHLATADLVAITDALTEASEVYGVSLVAAGNFMTNDETGAAFANDAYERMKSLLGVTITSSGSTDGIDLAAGTGSNPILADYADGEAVGSYANTGYLGFSDVTGTGEVLFTQTVGQGGATSTVAGVIATETGARNVHFASDAIIGNNNILHEALDWATQDDNPGVSLALTRNDSLFYARNDMDQSQEVYAVIDYDPSIYDLMLPIVENWYDTYGFTGSYYINIGAYAPDQLTDWSVSKPYFDQLIALEGEIGSHSYSHPNDTNLLLPDQVTQALIDQRALAYSEIVDHGVVCWCPYCTREDTSEAVLQALSQMDADDINAMLADTLARTDPNNPDAIDPTELSEVERAVLEASYRFQFEYSKLMIEQGMGIDVTGAAVPGAPEKLEASREIIKFYEYLSGGYSAEGAGYPNAYGYLTPADTGGVYLAPNMSFDFTLVEFLGMTPAEAEAVWAAEYADLSSHATTPVYIFPWHDYGPTNFDDGGEYTVEMFESVIAQAAADGTEFVTGDDLASRIKSFAGSAVTLSQEGSVVTAQVTSTDAGKFALDVSESGTIASVANWYAYDDTKVFLPANGGTFEIALGTPQAGVTHVAALPMRADLLTVSGDGEDLAFSFTGRGDVDVALASQGAKTILVTGADGGEIGASSVTLAFDTVATHSAAIAFGAGNTIAGTAGHDIAIGGSGDDIIAGGGGDDLLMGAAGADTFILATGFGQDTVLDFTAGSDTLDVSDLGFETSAEAYAAFAQTGGGLELAHSPGDTLLLPGLTLAQFDEDDIVTGSNLVG